MSLTSEYQLPICEHVSRLTEYLNNMKLTIAPRIADRRFIEVYCRKCDRAINVKIPLVDDVADKLAET